MLEHSRGLMQDGVGRLRGPSYPTTSVGPALHGKRSGTPYVREASAFAAHLFFSAATIAARPALLNFRLDLDGSAAAADFAPLTAAQRFRCASAIALRPAALIVRVFFVPSAGRTLAALPFSIVRSSAICASIRVFWASNPSIAALMTSVVSFCVAMAPPMRANSESPVSCELYGLKWLRRHPG